jgi:hypothetical protein
LVVLGKSAVEEVGGGAWGQGLGEGGFGEEGWGWGWEGEGGGGGGWRRGGGGGVGVGVGLGACCARQIRLLLLSLGRRHRLVRHGRLHDVGGNERGKGVSAFEEERGWFSLLHPRRVGGSRSLKEGCVRGAARL